MKTSTIALTVQGKTVQAYLAAPDGGGPGLLVLHAWWGLKPFFKQLCDRLAQAGFVALAPDLNNGQIANTVPEAEALMKRRDDQFTGDVVMAAKEALRGLPAVKGKQIGVMGFSMGGAWSLVAADRDPEHVGAAVLYYGNYVFDFSRIRAKILGHFAGSDPWEPLEGVRDLEAGLKKAGVPAEIHVYPGCQHWFVEEDRPEYNPEVARQAWERSLAFLHSCLD